MVTGLWNHVESGRLAGFSVLPDPAFSRVSGRYSRACWSPERVLSGVFLDGARFFSLSRALPFLGWLVRWVSCGLVSPAGRPWPRTTSCVLAAVVASSEMVVFGPLWNHAKSGRLAGIPVFWDPACIRVFRPLFAGVWEPRARPVGCPFGRGRRSGAARSLLPLGIPSCIGSFGLRVVPGPGRVDPRPESADAPVPDVPGGVGVGVVCVPAASALEVCLALAVLLVSSNACG